MPTETLKRPGGAPLTANDVSLMSVEEIAARTKICVRDVWRASALYKATDGREGLGPSYKMSHRVTRFRVRSVDAWIESRRVVL